MHTLFLSAATLDHKQHRTQLASQISELGGESVNVITQESISENGHFTLEMLVDAIRKSDGVLHLIGRSPGAKPAASSITKFMQQREIEVYLKTYNLSRTFFLELSYTQWEAWLALLLDKPLFIARDASLASSFVDTNDQAKGQLSSIQHLAALASADYYPDRSLDFDSETDLALKIKAKGSEILRDLSRAIHPQIKTLHEFIGSISSGFRRFLLTENMPFLPPGKPEEYSWHPETVFEHLQRERDKPGVVLSAVGGAGKTRTTLEISRLAAQKGWRVLYVIPDASNSNLLVDDIIDAILIARSKKNVLIAIEYVEQLTGVDLNRLSREMSGIENIREIKVRIIANCRPAYIRRTSAQFEAMFEYVRMELSKSYARDLSAYVAERSAPIASDRLTASVLHQICGTRPIIALLIAQQLEELAKADANQLTQAHITHAGTDLGYWLRTRLENDNLLPKVPENEWEPVSIAPELTLAIAFLGYAPVHSEVLEGSFSQIAELESGLTESKLQFIKSRLVKMGWLMEEEEQLNIAHDAVFDHLVENIVFADEFFRSEEIGRILKYATSNVELFIRACINLDRAISAMDRARAGIVAGFLSDWGKSNLSNMQECFRIGGPGATSFAFGALLDSENLSGILDALGYEYTKEWLGKYSSERDARHLIYKSLTSGLFDSQALDFLRNCAMTWLDEWGQDFKASFVIAPTLRYLRKGHEDRLLVYATRWLQQFGSALEAQHVLREVVNVGEADPAQMKLISGYLIEWLECHYLSEGAGFVLGAIKNTEYGALDPDKNRKWSFGWLHVFPDHRSAAFILAQTLKKIEEPDKLTDTEFAHSLEVIEACEDIMHVEYVFQELFQLCGKENDGFKQLVLRFVHLMKQSAYPEKASFVSKALISNLQFDVGEDLQTRLEGCLEEWLRRNLHCNRANHILTSVLLSKSFSPEMYIRVSGLAHQWLNQYARDPEADYVLRAVLVQSHIPKEQLFQTLEWSKEWIETYPDTEGALFLLSAVLPRLRVSDDLQSEFLKNRSRLKNVLKKYLELRHDCFDARALFECCLKSQYIDAEILGLARKYVGVWVEKYRRHYHAAGLIKHLMVNEGPESKLGKESRVHALHWLGAYWLREESVNMLWLLIKNDDGHIVNSSEFQDSLGEWITAFECDPECGKVIHAVFKESKIESTICAGLVSACLNWIEKRIHCESSRLPLQECISRFINDHSGNQKVRDRILHVATHWLSINVHAEEFRYVMPLAFDFAKKWSDTDTNIWSTLWEYSASWLKLYKTSAEAGYVIEKCLLVPIFSKDRGADVLTILAFWITFNWPERYALKQFRYACGNAPEEMSVEFVERLLPFFVEKKQADKIDQFFINQYCSNYRNRKVPEKSFVQLIGAAKQWLNKYRRSKYACFVIGPILWRSELSVGDRDYFKREAEEWVSLYGEDDVAHIVSEPYSQFKELD